jgi:membrane protease YdiL (CAAX protease family)
MSIIPAAMLGRVGRLVLSMALCAGAASAAATVSTPEAGVERVRDAKVVAYREVLEGYDAAVKGAPDDAALAVARCRFIGSFTDEEYGDWVDSAPDEYEACQEALRTSFSSAPDVLLFDLQNMWGTEAVEEGERLLEAAGDWPAPLRKALLIKLSEAHSFGDNKTRAGELALMATELGEHSLVPEAIGHLVAKDRFAEAIALLRRTPAATGAWEAKRRVDAALLIPERKWARWELARYAKSEFAVPAESAARAHLHAGDAAAARALVKKADATLSDNVRFDVLVAAGDLKAASALVDLADLDAFTEQMRRFAIVLVKSPATLGSWAMLKAVLICLACVALFALLPGLLLVPAHYRGLIRRSRGQPPRVPLFESVGLRHAWLGLTVILLAPMVVGVLAEPESTVALLGETLPSDAAAFFRATLWGTIASLLCAIPIARRMRMREVFGDAAAWRAVWWVVGLWIVIVGVSALISLAASQIGSGQAGNTPSPHSQLMDILAVGGREVGGPILALLLVALLVPVIEELVFRGLLLGGLSRHLSFGWANALQAALFAVIHDDPRRLPFYFAMGLTTGWLTRKTRSLAPAIALHALNNLIAFSLKLF